MPHYNNSKIYRVVNDINGMNYYGSTTLSLSKRMAKHRWSCRNMTRKTYLKFGNIEDCKIFLIENYPCKGKEELMSRERYYIENNACVNKAIPGRSNAEFMKQYRLKNKIIIAEKNKEYRLKNKTIIAEKDKQYRIKNKIILNEKQKQYRLDNQDKLRKKTDCVCGGKFTHSDRSRHFKTKKHLNYLENKTKQ